MAHRTDVTKHPEHGFKVQRVGPIEHGQGGKPAKTRFRYLPLWLPDKVAEIRDGAPRGYDGAPPNRKTRKGMRT